MKNLKLLNITLLVIINICCHKAFSQSSSSFVNPFIGTGAHGHTYPGAVRPFGMVQLSPDGYNDTWDWVSGYHYSDSSIMGFSHTHLSGTGIGDLLDVLVTPTVGKLQLVPGTKANPDAGYRSRFSHTQERATPGYYSVYLKDYKIQAELTTSERVGFHQYTFPATDSANIIIDLAHMSLAKKEWICKLHESDIHIMNDSMITGYRRTSRFAKNRTIYFALIFSKPFLKSGIEKNSVLDSQIEASGKNYRAYVNFKTSEGEAIKIKVAISGVSIEGALSNLKEIPHWDFSQTKTESAIAWEKYLSKVKVDKGDIKDLTTFYTALYHSMLAPNLYSDLDGNYRGLDDKIHTTKDFDYYTNFSLWDTYRAAHPLFTLICPDKVDDFANSMIRMGAENPDGFFPVWPLHNGETYCMNGCHSITVICEAYLKGIRGFDIVKAYPEMKKQLLKPNFFRQGDYINKKYFPYDKIEGGASRTLEHSYTDAAFSYLASALGKKEDAAYFSQRSKNYQSLYRKEYPYVQPRDSNGAWISNFKPDALTGFSEGNSWQYTWAVPHQPEFLVKNMGGNDKYIALLDSTFEQKAETGHFADDMTGVIGQYAHGNEPSHHIAYMYNFAGAWNKTQQRVIQIRTNLYNSTPEGLCGNDDMGQMSAWYVFSALGFYPVDPASGRYEFGSPAFESIKINLSNGKIFEIKSRKNVIGFTSVTLNGKAYTPHAISHKSILQGGVLTFLGLK